MTDQCKPCELRGDIEKCLAADCFHHENWYAKKQQELLNEAREKVEVQRLVIKKLERQIHEEPRW